MEENKSDIEKSLEKLKDSPLFTLSLGSKELFHSNFLYWLINAGILGTKENGKEITGKELFCEIIKDLSGIKINPEENWIARREKMNFDLSLWETEIKKIGGKNKREEEIDTKCLLVIENKMKSVPSVKQIVEYIHKFDEDKIPRFILLTLMENFPDRKKIEEPTKELLEEWEIKELDCKIITYRNLVYKLKKLYKPIQFSNKYFEDLISDYCAFVDILSQLGDTNRISENSSMMLNLDYDINFGFEKLRILQLIQAIRVGVLYKILKEKFSGKKYENIKFYTGYGRNGGAYLEILYAIGSKRDKYTGKEADKKFEQKLKNGKSQTVIKGKEHPSHRSIGIQIQADRYAHFVCPLDYKDSSEDKEKEQDDNWVNEKFKGFFAQSNKDIQV